MIDLPSGSGGAGFVYSQPPAIYRRAQVESRPRPSICAAGTGGLESGSYYRARLGYQLVTVSEAYLPKPASPYVDMMSLVKGCFGRTMSQLPGVFGVSRQTLYNWLKGETPRDLHQQKIRELAEAAKVFHEFGYKPTAQSLHRAISQGQSFLELMSAGASGGATAKKLIRVGTRSSESKAKLGELLGARKASLSASDMGTLSLDEDA